MRRSSALGKIVVGFLLRFGTQIAPLCTTSLYARSESIFELIGPTCPRDGSSSLSDLPNMVDLSNSNVDMWVLEVNMVSQALTWAT